MAQIIINIPDSVLPRLLRVFKTQLELETWLKHQLKVRFIGQEVNQLATAREQQILEEVW